MKAMPTLSANDGPRFHSDMPVSEITEHVTRAIEASDVSSTTLVAETVDGVTHKTWPTPTEPNGARGLEPSDPNSGIRSTKVRRLAHEGLKATSCRIEPEEKMQINPSGLCPTRSEADRVIVTFLFDPNLEPSPQNLHRGEASRPPELVSRMIQASVGRWVKEQWNAT